MLSYEELIQRQDVHVEHLLRHQEMRPDHAWYGAFILPDYGVPTADHVSGGAATAAVCNAVLLEGSIYHGDNAVLERAEAAVAALRKQQRPTGRIDLSRVNMDTAPDTGFLLQYICPVLELARRLARDGDDEAARRLDAAITPFVESAARGVIDGGFHTPNHRWVICSGLAQAMSLCSEVDGLPYADSLLAEGVDINEDGAYSERSIAIYDTVCNRSFRMIADHLNRPQYLEPVRANLDYCVAMLESDGRVLTALSKRQDKGPPSIPVGAVDSFYDMAKRDGRSDWAQVAEMIVAASKPDEKFHWLLERMVSNPAYRKPGVTPKPLPATAEYLLPKAGVWRVREGRASYAAMMGSPTLLTARYGEVELRHVGAWSTYLHTGVFEGETLERTECGVRLTHTAKGKRPPSAWLPLGRSVVFDDPHKEFYPMAEAQRERRLLPPMSTAIEFERLADGLNLHLRINCGLDRMPYVVALGFKPGGICFTPNLQIRTNPDQDLLLSEGHLTIIHGDDAICLGPGASEHATEPVFEYQASPGLFRVLIPLLAPFERTLEIRWGRWSWATRDLL